MLGIREGWRCWEVGVGGPSVPQWLSARVGPSGHVLATDIDVSWASQVAGGNIDVRRHDVAVDDPPADAFDLVHARLVLIHVPQRDQALRRMVASVRAGGWLLIEDFAGGHASAEEIEAHLAALERGRLDVSTPPLISAWGRRA